MEITEVRIKLVDGLQDRLLGFCSITIDGVFVIRDLKIIKGTRGAFVAMPSRKLTDRCPACRAKNQLRAAYCSQCGVALGGNRSQKLPDGRAKLYADIAHPINNECRDLIQNRVLEAYEEELELAKDPDYVCRYDDFDDDSSLDALDNWLTDENLVIESPPAAHGHRHWHPGNSQQRPHTAPTQFAHTETVRRSDDFGAGLF